MNKTPLMIMVTTGATEQVNGRGIPPINLLFTSWPDTQGESQVYYKVSPAQTQWLAMIRLHRQEMRIVWYMKVNYHYNATCVMTLAAKAESHSLPRSSMCEAAALTLHRNTVTTWFLFLLL